MRGYVALTRHPLDVGVDGKRRERGDERGRYVWRVRARVCVAATAAAAVLAAAVVVVVVVVSGWR